MQCNWTILSPIDLYIRKVPELYHIKSIFGVPTLCLHKLHQFSWLHSCTFIIKLAGRLFLASCSVMFHLKSAQVLHSFIHSSPVNALSWSGSSWIRRILDMSWEHTPDGMTVYCRAPFRVTNTPSSMRGGRNPENPEEIYWIWGERVKLHAIYFFFNITFFGK